MKGTLLVLLILFTGFSVTESVAQSVAPISASKTPFVGIGMHGLLSISQENTSVAGVQAQLGYFWKKIGLSLSPEFNAFQYRENQIKSGFDFSATFLGHLRTTPRIGLALGTNIQITQKVTNKQEWDTVSDISIVGGLGKNWPLGPLHLALSGLLKYNPSASDFSIGADVSLNYPF